MKKILFFCLSAALYLPVWAEAPREPGEKTKRYHKLLLKRPESATLFERFVGSWLDEASKEDLEKFLKDSATSGSAAEWRLLATYQNWMGREELALKAISNALKEDPQSKELFFTRAKLKARLLDFEGALIDLEKVPNDFNEESATLKGSWLARSGQPEKALAAWKEILAARPNDEELREDLIELQIGEGLYEEAIKTGKSLAEGSRDPYKKAIRLLKVASTQVIAGKQKDGLKTYREVLNMSGEGSWLEKEVLAQVEKVFRREENIVGLREYYTELRDSFPQRVSLRKGLVFQMAANGEIDEAIALFREVLKITPNNLENRQQFLTLLESVERYDLAIEEQEFILRKRADQPKEWERMASLRNLKGDKKGLREALEKVRAMRAKEPQGIIITSALYKRYKIRDEAEAILRKGRADFPNNHAIHEALAAFLADSPDDKEKQKEATNLWVKMAKGSDAEGLLRVSRALLSHQRTEACFELLSKRISEFPENVLLLKQLCNSAATIAKEEEALPYALKLAELAGTPSELGAALGEVSRLARRLDLQNVISKHKDKAGKTAKDWCVLAELYEIQGDVLSSDQALAEAKKIENGPLILSQKIRLLESRDELAEAAQSMRELIALPGGNRPVYLKKLVVLLSSSGKLDEALATAEQWKQVAPGDRRAWLKRAELLEASGELEKAVAELRRAQAKFEDDVELKSRLADAMVAAGDYSEGERIYRKLFQEADSDNSRVRWIEQLVSLAQQENRTEELLEEFERRKRRNPNDIAPLQALATIHARLGDYALQREALAEAVRRKPNVIGLRHQLAQVEERAGDINGAMVTMREAARLDKKANSRQKLVSLYFRHSEIEKGLDLLREMNSGDPREVEATAQALMQNGEWETALEYLAEYSGSDWRLTFLAGISEYNKGEQEKARTLFRNLTEVTDEINGLKPLITDDVMQRWKAWLQPHSIVEPTREMLLTRIMASGANRYLNFRVNRTSSSYYRRNAQQQMFPGTTEEMRALARAILIQDAYQKSGDEKTELLNKISYPAGLFGQQLKNQHRIAAWVTEEMKAGKLDLATAVSLAAGDEDLDIEVLKRAANELANSNPKAADAALRGLIQRKEGDSNDHMMKRLELLKKLPDDVRNLRLNQVAGEIFGMSQNSYYGQVSEIRYKSNRETKETIKNVLINEVEHKPENQKRKAPLQDQFWFQAFLAHAWRTGDAETFVQLANHLTAEHKKPSGGAQGLAYSNRNYYSSYYSGGRQQSKLVVPPSFPRMLTGAPAYIQQILISNAQQRKKQGSSAKTGKQEDFVKKWRANRKLAADKDGAERTDGMQPEDLAPFVAKLESPYLRLLSQFWMNQPEALEKELLPFESSQNAEEVLSAAAYWFQKGKIEKSYQLLTKARLFPMDKSERKRVDGELVLVGSQLAKSGTSPEKLEDARRAVLRLRRSAQTDEETEQLIATMTMLSMGDIATQIQMARLRKQAMGNNGGSSQFGGGLSPRANNVDLNGKNKDDGARAALRNLRALLRSQSSWGVEEFVKKIQINQLTDRILKLAHPGETRSYSRKMEFAKIADALGKGKEALPVLQSLAKDRPDDAEVSALLIRHLPREETVNKARAMMKSAKPQEFGQFILKLTRRGHNDPFRSEDSIENIEQAHQFLDALSIATEYLSELEIGNEASDSLSWVTALASKETFDRWSLGDDLSPGLLLASKRETDFEKKRFEVTRQLMKAGLRHPQLASQMFFVIEAHKKGLNYSEEEILQFALDAYRTNSALKTGSNNVVSWSVNTGGRNYTSEHNIKGKYPDEYLSEVIIRDDGNTSKKLLQELEEFAPGKVKQLSEIKLFATGTAGQAKEIMVKWESNLSNDPYERISEYQTLLYFAIHSGAPENRLHDLEKNFFLDLIQNIASLRNQNAFRMAKPALAYMQKLGPKAMKDYHDRMLTTFIGPKEIWPEWLNIANSNQTTDYDLMLTNYLIRSYGREVVESCQSLDQILAVASCKPLLWGGENSISRTLENLYETPSIDEAESILKEMKFWARPWAQLGQSLDMDGETVMMEVFLEALLDGNQYTYAKKIGKATGGRKFRNRLAAAFLSQSYRSSMPREIEAVATGLMKLPAEELAGVKNLIGRLYPSFRIPNAKPKTKLLLEKLGSEKEGDLLAQARQQIKEGFGGQMHNYSGRKKIMEQTLALISNDPKLAAEFFAAAINDPPNNQRNSYTSYTVSYGYSHPTRQDELFDDLLRDAEEIQLKDWAKFQNHFERMPSAPKLSVGHAERNALRDLLQNFWDNQPKSKNLKGLEGKIFNNVVHWNVLPKVFAKEDRSVQETSAWLLWLYSAGRWEIKNPLAHWQWMQQSKYLQKHSIFGQRNLTRLAQHAWNDIPEEAHQLAQKAWLDVLSNEDLTTRLRMELACKSIVGEPRLSDMPETVAQVSQLMEKYIAEGRALNAEPIVGLLSGLNELNTPLVKEKWVPLLKACSNAYLKIAAKRNSDKKIKKEFAIALINIGIKIGDTETVKSTFNLAKGSLRGDLTMMLDMIAVNQPDLAKQLVSSPDQVYIVPSDIKWTPELDKQMMALLPLIKNEKERFRIHCILANLPLQNDEHKKERTQKLLALAERFKAEAPQAAQARMQCLRSFLKSRNAQKILFDEIEKVNQTYSIVSAFDQELMPGNLSAENVEDIIRHHIWSMARQGRLKVFDHQVKNVARALAADEKDYSLNRACSGFFHDIMNGYLNGKCDRKETTVSQEDLALAKEWYRLIGDLNPSNSLVRHRSVALPYFIYTLAGQSKKFHQWIGTLPNEEQAAYKREFSKDSFYIATCWSASRVWSDKKDTVEQRTFLTKALLSDHHASQAIFGKYFNIRYLVNHKVLKIHEYDPIIVGLPKDHPQAAFFKTQLGAVYGRYHGNKRARGIKLLREAIAEAESKKDAVTINTARAELVFVIGEKTRKPKEALEIASKIDWSHVPPNVTTSVKKKLTQFKQRIKTINKKPAAK